MVRRLGLVVVLLMAVVAVIIPGTAVASGPSGSTECHLSDDDCDGSIDEDPIGDANGDGNLDDDGDGAIDEDPAGDATDAGENQVDCNEQSSQNVGGLAYVSAGSGGAEACADDSSQVPLDGRIIVDADDGYIAVDGDNSNPAPSNGYARLDENGMHCGDEQNQDSTADQSGNTAEDCG
jgi:hypothetical protein